jgi:hypothetical protein
MYPYRGSRQYKKVHTSSGDSVGTPDWLLKNLEREFGELFDPCPMCQYDPKTHTNGLEIDWKSPCFVNPPFSNVKPWVLRAANSTNVRILLVKLDVILTNYFREYAAGKCEVRVLGKLKFKGYDKVSPFACVLLIWGNNREGKLTF